MLRTIRGWASSLVEPTMARSAFESAALLMTAAAMIFTVLVVAFATVMG